MTRTLEGEPKGQGRCFAVVVSRFNSVFTDKLLAACVRTLHDHQVADHDVHVAYVPGAVEIPLASQALAQTGRYAAVIALGCVIRGDTAHFEHVATAASRGATDVSLKTGVPVIFGVLTPETIEQAKLRTEGPENKGIDAALSALEMADLLSRIDGNS